MGDFHVLSDIIFRRSSGTNEENYEILTQDSWSQRRDFKIGLPNKN